MSCISTRMVWGHANESKRVGMRNVEAGDEGKGRDAQNCKQKKKNCEQ